MNNYLISNNNLMNHIDDNIDYDSDKKNNKKLFKLIFSERESDSTENKKTKK